MLFYFAKTIECIGLVIIAVGFIERYPQLMNPKILLAGMLIFICGWMIERFLLKR
jgi:hypothetical protein